MELNCLCVHTPFYHIKKGHTTANILQESQAHIHAFVIG